MRVVRGLHRAGVTDLRVAGVEDLTAALPRDPAPLARELRRQRPSGSRSGGYDRRFRRLWDLYFACCEGGFVERRIAVAQFSWPSRPTARSLENMRFEIASSSNAGPREASLASASLPPGPSM